MLEVEPLLLRAVATLQVWRPYESESQLSPYGPGLHLAALPSTTQSAKPLLA
jgi:hypothetical protein